LKLKGTSIYFRQILVFLKGKHDVYWNKKKLRGIDFAYFYDLLIGRGIVYSSGILQFQVPICSKVQLFSIFVNKALSLKTNYPLHIFYKSMSGNIQNKLIIITTMTNVIHHYINICKTQINVQSSNPCPISMSQTLVPQIYVLFFSNHGQI
jgi:hypothetical protein